MSMTVEQDGGRWLRSSPEVNIPDHRLPATTPEAGVVEHLEREPEWTQHQCLDNDYDESDPST
jgi:hypothetical protein